MNDSRRKVLGSVLGIIIFIICIMSLSYAWYKWRSANTNVDIGIHEGGLKFVYSNNNILESSNLSPILDYTDDTYYTNNNSSLIYADYTTTNTTNDTYKMIIKLNITELSDALKDSSFKWVLLEKEGNSYSKVIENGDFSSLIVGSNILNEGIYVPPSSPVGSTSSDYRFVMYIDGNIENSSSMMNSTIKSSLELCDEKVPVFNISLNNQNATSGHEGTGKIYEKYGVGIYKDSTASTTLMTTSANPITAPGRTGYTFSGYYTSTNCSGDQLINNSGYITSKFTSTYTNKDMTLYACWKDTTAPTLTLTRTGTVEGFKGWNLTSGASVDSSQILTLASTSAKGTSPFYQVDEQKYEWSYDAYTTATASEYTPNGGYYTGTYYYDSSFAAKVGSNGYANNGQSASIPLNTWKSIGASNYNYGTGIEYFKINMRMSSSWSMPTTKYRNFKVMGDIYAKRKYTINVSSSDSGSGIKVKKYASGSQNASYFKSSGTTFTGNSFNVTANGTYTVYIEDNSGNTTVKTIAINKIDNATPNISSFTASSDYAQTSTISATATDSLAGIVSYAFTSSNTEPTSWTTINTNKSAYTATNTVSNNGTYYVWFMDSASNIASKSVNVTKVDKTKPVCTIATPASVVYGSTTTVAVSCTDNASMPSQTLSTSSFTTSNNTVAQITAVSAPTAITNGYKYTLTVKGVGVGSYNISMNAGVIKDSAGNTNNKVTSGNGSVTAKNISSTTITLNPTTYVYDGKAKTPTVTVKDGSTTLTKDTHYTVSYSNNTNVGTATATITGKGNYNGTATKTFTITKANSSISLSPKTATYTGSAIAANKATVTGTTGAVTYTYYTNSSCSTQTTTSTGASGTGKAPVDVGNYYVKATAAASSNYNSVTSSCVAHTINKKSIAVTWGSTITFTYNGSAQAPSITTPVTGAGSEKLNLTRTTGTNVGSYTSTASCSSVSGGRAKCTNYTLTGNTKAFTINKANSSISLTAKTATYTGSAIAANTASVTGTTGAVTYTYYTNSSCSTQTTTSTGASATGGAPVDAGTYYVKATAAASSNYNAVTSSCVAHKINKKSIAVTWGSTTSFTYNGSAQAPSITTPVTGAGSEKLNLTRTTGTNVGSYTSTASCSSVTGGRAKCTNYTLTGNTKAFTINKANSSISLTAKTATYTGSEIAANTASVTGTTGAVTYTYYMNSSCSTQTTTSTGASATGAAPVDAGTYYVKATVAASSNYNAVTSSCVAHTISKKSIAVTWGSTTSFTYNGSAQAPTVTTPVAGAGSEKLNLTRTTGTNVGSYTSTASCSSVTGGRAKCTNYTLTGNTKAFTINKANSSISLTAKTATYTGSAIAANTASVTGTTGAVTYTYYTNSSCSTQATTSTGASTTGKAPVDAGTYYVKATAAASSNYNAVTSSCVAHKINKKSIAVTWGSTTSFTYNGSAQAPSITTPVTGAGSEKLNLTRTTGTNVGSYTSTASCSSVSGGRAKCTNYTLTGNTKAFTISYSTFSITLNNNGATSAGTTTLYMRYMDGIYLDNGYTKKMTTSANPITVPTKTGYNFAGYYDGNTIMIDSAGKITSNFTNTKYSSAKTLTANWNPINYTITYNLGGGTDPGNPKSYNIETPTFTLKNPTRVGYNFAGWTGSNGSTPQTTVTISKGSTGNKSYTANWTRNFKCGSKGSTTNYAGLSWYTINNSNGICELALNGKTKVSGSYNDATTKLDSSYFTSGGSDYNATMTKEKKAGLLAKVNGSYYIDTNGGTSYSTSKPTGSSWVASGTIWDGDSHNQYSQPTASRLFKSWTFNTNPDIGWSGLDSQSFTRNVTAPSSIVLTPTTRGVPNGDSAWGCVNCKLEGGTNYLGEYASLYLTLVRPQQYAGGANFIMWVANTYGNTAGQWSAWAHLMYACGGYGSGSYQGVHGEESNRFIYLNNSTCRYQRLAHHPEVNDIADIPYWNAGSTQYSWYYAGVAGNTTGNYYAHINSYYDNGNLVYQYKFDSSGAGGQYCKSNWPNYTVGATFHDIYYRPHIKVKM